MSVIIRTKASHIGKQFSMILLVLFQVTLLRASEKPFFPVANQTRNARGILSAYFNNIKPACINMQQRSVEWFNTLSTPQKCAVGLGAAGITVVSGLYLRSKLLPTRKKSEVQPTQSAQRRAVVSSSSSNGNNNVTILTVQELVARRHRSPIALDHELQGIVKTRNVEEKVVLQEAFDCLMQNKSIGGDIRLANIADLISCGANPFAQDVGGIPQFIHLADEISPEFLFSCLGAPALANDDNTALRPQEIKAGIKDSLVKLLGMKAEFLEERDLTHVFDTIISFVTQDVTVIDANKALGAYLRFTSKDWQDVLVAAGVNVQDAQKWYRLAELVQTAQTPTQSLREFVQKVHARVVSPDDEQLFAFWFEQLRAGADSFHFEEGSSVNAFALLAMQVEHEYLISSLKAKVGFPGEKQRVLSDEQIQEGVRHTLLMLKKHSGFDITIANIRAAIAKDASGTFPAAFLQDLDAAEENTFSLPRLPICSSSEGSSCAGVPCSIYPQRQPDGSITAYKIILGHSKEYICSDVRSLPAFIVQKLQNDFGIVDFTTQAVKDFLKLHKILKSSKKEMSPAEKTALYYATLRNIA